MAVNAANSASQATVHHTARCIENALRGFLGILRPMNMDRKLVGKPVSWNSVSPSAVTRVCRIHGGLPMIFPLLFVCDTEPSIAGHE